MIQYEDLSKVNESFHGAFRDKFEDVAESGLYILGKHVADFEKHFAAYCNSTYCTGVGSGLDALILSLRALNFGPNKEVLVPSNTYFATILSILRSGLKPVLVEPDIASYNIDPRNIEKAITHETVAILVVHLYGKCCAMDEILAICQEYKLKLIEDCAQSHGAMYKGKKAGTFGDAGAFSFYPTKNLGALGDGGAIVTNDEALFLAVKELRNYGSSARYYNDVVGYNSRLDELQAAFLSVKLAHLDTINAHKRKLASLYDRYLDGKFIKPMVEQGYDDVYHIYAIRHPERDKVRAYLLENDIQTEIHYPVPPHRQKAMKGMTHDTQFPISDEIHDTIVSLPISYFHTENDVQRVVDVLNRF